MDNVRFDQIPRELMELDNWLLWRHEKRGKVPYRADSPRYRGSPTDPKTWAPFEAAQAAYRPGRDSGLGFALDGSGQACIDIDGDVTPRAIDLLQKVGCRYIEYSPSNDGLHGWGWFKGTLTRKKGVYKGLSVEIYNSSRYMTVTGNVIQAGKFEHLPALNELSKQLVAAPDTQEDTRKTQENSREHRITQDNSSHIGGHASIERYLPEDIRQRNRQLFEFGRHLKAKYPEATAKEVRHLVKQWHSMALPVIGTLEFAETWADFTRGWKLMKYPEGALLNVLLDGVEHDPLPTGVPDDIGDNAILIAKICRRLQDHEEPGPFYLSARKAGELVGINKDKANRLIKGLLADDVIELVERGKLEGRQASQYRMKRHDA